MYNGHADVTALLKPDGTIMAAYRYDPFGNAIDQATKDNLKNIENPYTYAGYRFDDESGLYYLNARYYDPATARFMSEDTYKGDPNDPLSLNLYTYCSNNPITYWDPTGHWAQDDEHFKNQNVRIALARLTDIYYSTNDPYVKEQCGKEANAIRSKNAKDKDYSRSYSSVGQAYDAEMRKDGSVSGSDWLRISNTIEKTQQTSLNEINSALAIPNNVYTTSSKYYCINNTIFSIGAGLTSKSTSNVNNSSMNNVVSKAISTSIAISSSITKDTGNNKIIPYTYQSDTPRFYGDFAKAVIDLGINPLDMPTDTAKKVAAKMKELGCTDINTEAAQWMIKEFQFKAMGTSWQGVIAEAWASGMQDMQVNSALAITGMMAFRRGVTPSNWNVIESRIKGTVSAETAAAEVTVNSAIDIGKLNSKPLYRVMTESELNAVKDTGYLRGGRSGPTYFTDSYYKNASNAQNRLSLPNKPEYIVEFKITNKPTVTGGNTVKPDYGGSGGGREYFSNDPVQVDIVNYQKMK